MKRSAGQKSGASIHHHHRRTRTNVALEQHPGERVGPQVAQLFGTSGKVHLAQQACCGSIQRDEIRVLARLLLDVLFLKFRL